MARVLAIDHEAAPEAVANVDERGGAPRGARVYVGAKSLARDRGVRARDERGDLAVSDLAVSVGIGAAVEPGAHLVTEDAALEALPLVTLARG